MCRSVHDVTTGPQTVWNYKNGNKYVKKVFMLTLFVLISIAYMIVLKKGDGLLRVKIVFINVILWNTHGGWVKDKAYHIA